MKKITEHKLRIIYHVCLHVYYHFPPNYSLSYHIIINILFRYLVILIWDAKYNYIFYTMVPCPLPHIFYIFI